ncbi:somatostatin receptor type 4-like [Haliotis asinina]|uniref:somatostatin receptor type 4-like n=1 Tax=Haliotis asinina TaxID=109174 RepID=UPI003531A4FB
MDPRYIWRVLGYVQIVLCLLGIIGNAISVYVLSQMKSKSLRLLKYLNMVDIVLLAMVCTWVSMAAFMSEGFQFPLFLNIVFLCTGALIIVVQTFEAYLTVLVAIVRCVAVAMPFKFTTCMRDSVQNKLLIASAVFSLLFNLPDILVQHLTSPHKWISHFSVYFQQIFCKFLPILAIVICNIILVVSRCRMNSLKGQDNQCGSPNGRHGRSAFHLTCLVLAITAMFIATNGSFGVVYLCLLISPTVTELVAYIGRFSMLMIIINSATNFIFYCLIGSDFRTTLVSLCKKKPSSARRNKTMSVSTV